MADVADALIAPPDPSFGMSRNPYARRIAQALVGMGQGVATLPQRAFGASETMRQGGDYDPGPILEAATLPMGGGLTSPVRTGIGEALLGAGPTRAAPMWKTTATDEASKYLSHYKGDLFNAIRGIDSHPFWQREEGIQRAADIKNAMISQASPQEIDRVLKLEREFRDREGTSYSQYYANAFGSEQSHPKGLTDWLEWFDKQKPAEIEGPK